MWYNRKYITISLLSAVRQDKSCKKIYNCLRWILMKDIATFCCIKEIKIYMLELYMHNGACCFKLLHAVKNNANYIGNLI